MSTKASVKGAEDPTESSTEIVVMGLSGDDELVLKSTDFKTVGDIKRRLWSTHGVPPCAQQLIIGCDSLENAMPVRELPCGARLSLVRLTLDPVLGGRLHDVASGSKLAGVGIAADLLLQKADPEVRDARDRLPLHTAARCGQREVVQILLGAGAQPNAEVPDFGTTPLHFSSVAGHAEVTQILCEADADINATDGVGATPLIAATRMGHLSVVRALRQAGALVGMADEEGLTALVLASRLGHAKLVDELRRWESG